MAYVPSPERQALETATATVGTRGRVALLATVGSRAYGTNHAESDYDFKGVYVPRLDKTLCLQPMIGNLTRSANAVGGDGMDLTLYELGSFCRLAAAANPTVLELLWAPLAYCDTRWADLVAERNAFLSKRILKTYGGYAISQLKKAEAGTGGSRGQNHLTRDKFKLHTLRLIDAGIHALMHGEILVKHPDPETLKATAALPLDDVKRQVEAGFLIMEAAAQRSSLPDDPDFERIDRMIYRLRLAAA